MATLMTRSLIGTLSLACNIHVVDPADTAQSVDGSSYRATLTQVKNLLAGAYIHLHDEKTQNTGGGTFTSGDWRTRDITTEVNDDGGHCTLSSNQMTLAAGTYRCLIHCPAYAVNNHQARLQNVTDGTTLLLGTSERAWASDGTVTRSIISGEFTLASAKALEVQHRCSSTFGTSGMGFAANFTTEIYTIVEFWKVA